MSLDLLTNLMNKLTSGMSYEDEKEKIVSLTGSIEKGFSSQFRDMFSLRNIEATFKNLNSKYDDLL